MSFARSRRANFCTFPVEVFGISAKTMWRGHLASEPRPAPFDQLLGRRAMSGLHLDEGAWRLAPFVVRPATTAASCTPGCSNKASSTSIEEMFAARI